MQRPETSNSLTIFFLFFGVAAIDAVVTRNWLHVLFWLAIGVAFVLLSRRGKRISKHHS
jgi:hypothetical protein